MVQGSPEVLLHVWREGVYAKKICRVTLLCVVVEELHVARMIDYGCVVRIRSPIELLGYEVIQRP